MTSSVSPSAHARPPTSGGVSGARWHHDAMTGAVGRGVRRCGAVLALVLARRGRGLQPDRRAVVPGLVPRPGRLDDRRPRPRPPRRPPLVSPARLRCEIAVAGDVHFEGALAPRLLRPGLRADAGHRCAGSRRPGDRQPRDVRRLGRAPRAGQAVHLLRRHGGLRGAGRGRDRRREHGQQPRPRLRSGTAPVDPAGRGRGSGPRSPSSGSVPTRTRPSPRPSPTWTARVWRPSPPRPPTRTPRPTPPGAWAAGPDTPGVADAIDPRRLLREVRRADAEADVVVAYLHWGVQGERCPSADQRSLARRLVGAGADVVVGSHAHELQGDGRLGPGYVAYGLGNFAWYSPGPTGVLTLTVQPPREPAGRARVTASRWWPATIGADGLAAPDSGAAAAASRDRRSVAARVRRAGGERASARGQPRGDDPADPLELGRRHDGRHVARRVVAGVRRRARGARPAARRGRRTSGRCCAARPRRRSAAPARRAAASSARCTGSVSPADPTGTRSPTPTRSRETIPRTAARSRRPEPVDVVPRPVVVVVVRRPARLLGAERHEHRRQAGAAHRGRLGHREHHPDSRGVVLRAGRLRHRVEVRADHQVRLGRVEPGRRGDDVGRASGRDRARPTTPPPVRRRAGVRRRTRAGSARRPPSRRRGRTPGRSPRADRSCRPGGARRGPRSRGRGRRRAARRPAGPAGVAAVDGPARRGARSSALGSSLGTVPSSPRDGPSSTRPSPEHDGRRPPRRVVRPVVTGHLPAPTTASSAGPVERRRCSRGEQRRPGGRRCS